MTAPQVLDDIVCDTVPIGGQQVRRLGFGAMRVSNARDGAGVRDRDTARALVRHVVERGVNFIDTADIYGLGRSEEILGEVLAPFTGEVLVATKAGYEPRMLQAGETVLPASGRPDLIKIRCEKSLARLQVDQLDLYQVHVPDPLVPWADTVGAFADLQREGKVRHIGVSNVSVEQLIEARTIVDVVSVQNRFNAGDRGSDAVLQVCEQAGIAFLPYRPLLVGTAAGAVLDGIAAKHAVAPGQVALAWLLTRSPVVLAIPGTSSVHHADENIDAAWLTLDQDDRETLDTLGRSSSTDPQHPTEGVTT